MSVITLNNNVEQAITPAGLVWENPPERKTTGRYAAVAAALREKPGQWAVLRAYAHTHRNRAWRFASAINAGKLVDFRASLGGQFESVARTADDGSGRVYVRFVPGLDDTTAVA